jgi:hypothetical protein
MPDMDCLNHYPSYARPLQHNQKCSTSMPPSPHLAPDPTSCVCAVLLAALDCSGAGLPSAAPALQQRWQADSQSQWHATGAGLLPSLCSTEWSGSDHTRSTAPSHAPLTAHAVCSRARSAQPLCPGLEPHPHLHQEWSNGPAPVRRCALNPQASKT